jgi:hypothetical protein
MKEPAVEAQLGMRPTAAGWTSVDVVSSELIHVVGNRVTWHEVVGQVANLFTPFTTAGRIVARIGACVVEVERFKHMATAADEVQLNRRRAIIVLFDAEQSKSRQVHVESAALVVSYHRMLDDVSGDRVSRRFSELTQAILATLSGQMVTLTRRDRPVRLSDSLRLGETEAELRRWQNLVDWS